jgi:uncharacterized membrane protein YhfC
MNHFLISLNYALMVLIPVIVAVVIRRRTAAPWRFFFIGAVTFILSQVFHIPFNWLVQRSGLLPSDLEPWANLLLYAGFLGLSAGVFEETARYLTYRYWAKDARSWSRGLMLGAGHGGIEAILVGLLAAVGFAGLIATVNNEVAMNAIPGDQRALLLQSLAQITDAPWYNLLLGAVERVLAILTHLALSLLVLQVFLRRSIIWLFVAILYHALFNMIAVVGAVRLSPIGVEGVLAICSLFSLFIIFRLRGPEPVEVQPPSVTLPPTAAIDLKPTDEAINRSRFN